MSRLTLNKLKSQNGVATVESALIVIVFLMLVMGIIEFALLIFNVSSLVEATRFGSRYMTVNDPVIDLDSYTCDTLPSTISCDGNTKCDDFVSRMQKFYSPLTAANVEVEYRCSSTGFSGSYFDIYEVEMRLTGIEYKFITPGILGLDATVTLPDFKTTRLSEDLEHVPTT